MGADASNPRVLNADPLDDVARPVGARVVDDDQLVVDLLPLEYRRERRESGLNAVNLVVRRDYGGELYETTVQCSAFAS
jgi:hypothetical protein